MVLKFVIFLNFIFLFVKSELTLEKIDAVSDLSLIAMKHFSQWPKMKFDPPEEKAMKAFALSVSEMWEDKESSLYVVTRLANLVDEIDLETGKLSQTARVIRSFAEQSESRRVHDTEAVEEENKWEMPRESSVESGVDEILEQMYLRGERQAADAKVSQIIESRWNNVDKAIADIENAGKKDLPNLMTAMIRLGSNHRSLKFIAPELKAGMSVKLLSLPRMKLTPFVAKWLLTMDTYREDQMKLVKVIEKALKKRPLEKTTKQSLTSNDLLQLFTELQDVAQDRTLSENYFDDVMSVDGNASEENFYKTLKVATREKGIKAQQAYEQEINDQKVNDQEIKNQQVNYQKVNEQETNEQSNISNPQEQPKQTQQAQNQEQKSQKQPTTPTTSYFEEKEKREDEIDRIIADNKPEETFDNDGIYDSKEQAADRAGQITALILIIVIIVAAVGTYLYLRRRRNLRNRTMLVVNEALEQS